MTPGSRRFGSCLLLVLLAALVLLLMACSEPQMALSPTREVAREGEAGVLAAIEQSFRIDPAWVITRAPSGPFDGPSFMAEPDPDSGNRMIVSPIANASLPAGYTPDQWVEERIQAGLDAAETAQDASCRHRHP